MSSAPYRELNEAILNADIGKSYEEFLAIFDRYYAESVRVASDTTPASLTGKAHVLPVLSNFLIPLHVMAEIGGCRSLFGTLLSPRTSARSNTSSGPSIWRAPLEQGLITVHWSSARRWKGSRVIYERYFDHRQIGGPLTLIDLGLDGSPRQHADTKPS